MVLFIIRNKTVTHLSVNKQTKNIRDTEASTVNICVVNLIDFTQCNVECRLTYCCWTEKRSYQVSKHCFPRDLLHRCLHMRCSCHICRMSFLLLHWLHTIRCLELQTCGNPFGESRQRILISRVSAFGSYHPIWDLSPQLVELFDCLYL